MAELQDRLAEDLGLESLRMIAETRRTLGPRAGTGPHYAITAGGTVVLGVAAVLYAWLGH